MNKKDTSWDEQAHWYDKIVGEEGSYYHKEVIVPNLFKILGEISQKKILDLGCGQGFFSRILYEKKAQVYGIDLSQKLIQKAKSYPHSKYIHYHCMNAENMDIFEDEYFDLVISILSLGNIRNIDLVFKEIYRILKNHGKFYFVIIHPCFRIPRQSHWGYDESKKIQYRRIDRYSSSMEIPIITHPSKSKDELQDKDYSIMFHRSLSIIFDLLKKSKLLVSDLQEWHSLKKSVGKRAKEENRARREIPLFLMIETIKIL